MCQEPGFALVWGLKRSAFHCMHEDIHPKIVYNICESPHHRYTEEGYAQEHNVKHSNTEGIGEPDPSTVHDPSVGVHLTVRYANIHFVSEYLVMNRFLNVAVRTTEGQAPLH